MFQKSLMFDAQQTSKNCEVEQIKHKLILEIRRGFLCLIIFQGVVCWSAAPQKSWPMTLQNITPTRQPKNAEEL